MIDPATAIAMVVDQALDKALARSGNIRPAWVPREDRRRFVQDVTFAALRVAIDQAQLMFEHTYKSFPVRIDADKKAGVK